MLSKITWHQWWLFIAAATTAYYAFVALVFFRKDILRLLSGQRTRGNHSGNHWPETEYEDTEEETFDEEAEPAATGYEAEEEETIAADEQEDAATAAENPAPAENNPEEDEDLTEGQAEENLALMEAISEAIAGALSCYNGYANKEEVILKLAHVLKDYRDATAYELYEEAIDWHMNEQARLHCGTSLSERDLGRIRDSAAEL